MAAACEITSPGQRVLDRLDVVHTTAIPLLPDLGPHPEPPRVFRRLQLLRGWSHETSNKFSPEVRSRAVRMVLDHAGVSVAMGDDRFGLS